MSQFLPQAVEGLPKHDLVPTVTEEQEKLFIFQINGSHHFAPWMEPHPVSFAGSTWVQTDLCNQTTPLS